MIRDGIAPVTEADKGRAAPKIPPRTCWSEIGRGCWKACESLVTYIACESVQITRDAGNGALRDIGIRRMNPSGTKFAEILHLPAWQSAKEVV